MKSSRLFDSGEHKWIVLGRDTEKNQYVIDTNEYIVIHGGHALLFDPGGTEIFPQVLSEVAKHVEIEKIETMVVSHQDPDIASSLAMWLDLCPDIKIYCSWLWTGFISHFGMGSDMVLEPIPDEGMEISIGTSSASVYAVPAHYCHSPGNHSYYDPIANIVFSGDIGAALVPANADMFVNDFEDHIQYMDTFHKRWMPSTQALKAWVARIRVLEPAMICPQHGCIFKGETVNQFLDWLESLDVGHWLSEENDPDYDKAAWMRWKKT